MSLTISVTSKGQPRPFDEAKSVTFAAGDGYWEYLTPWFEDFNKKCSETLDLYEISNIDPKSLPTLVEELSNARHTTQQGPESTKVFLGTRTHMGRSEELHKEITRAELMAFIDKMIAITKEAMESGETLANLGD